LFQGRLFKLRYDKEKDFYDNFGYKSSSFKHRVLYDLRRKIINFAGHEFYAIEYEEKLFYSMSANSILFGTGMTRFNQKQLYKKFLKVIEVPPLARLDVSPMNDFKFYARFLAIYVTKMKKDWVRRDQSYLGEGLKERKEKQVNRQFEIDQAHYKKLMKDRDEFPEIAVPGPERNFYEREEKWKVKKKRKKRYKKLWRNSITLVDYQGVLEISYEMIQRRRKVRAEEENLFNQFGYSYVRREVEPIFKGFNKVCYSEP
jgi:hypothetical protein